MRLPIHPISRCANGNGIEWNQVSWKKYIKVFTEDPEEMPRVLVRAENRMLLSTFSNFGQVFMIFDSRGHTPLLSMVVVYTTELLQRKTRGYENDRSLYKKALR